MEQYRVHGVIVKGVSFDVEAADRTLAEEKAIDQALTDDDFEIPDGFFLDIDDVELLEDN